LNSRATELIFSKTRFLVFLEGKVGMFFNVLHKGHSLDPMMYNTIFEANRPMLEHLDKIYPGQILRIPVL
jgi:hypothetical protein